MMCLNKFKITSEVIKMRDAPVLLEQCQPILTKQEEKEIKKETENKLFKIFVKYLN